MVIKTLDWGERTIEFLDRYHSDGTGSAPSPTLRVVRKIIEFGDNHADWPKTFSYTPVRRAAVTALIDDLESIKQLSEEQLAIDAVFSPDEQTMLGVEGIKQAFLEAPDCIREMRGL